MRETRPSGSVGGGTGKPVLPTPIKRATPRARHERVTAAPDLWGAELSAGS